MVDLQRRRALVMGVANEQSIAWGIAQSLAAAGAELAFSYLPDATGRAEARVKRVVRALGSPLVLPCDVGEEGAIADLFRVLDDRWGELDVLVHSLAWAARGELGGEFSATSRQGFAATNEISAYSFIAAARHARPLMVGRQGSMVTVTYIGSQRAVPGYNVMGVAKAALEAATRYLAAELGPHGIRVNAVSSGPIETLSSSAVPGLDRMLTAAAELSPLRRNVSQREVGDAVAFLCSDLAARLGRLLSRPVDETAQRHRMLPVHGHGRGELHLRLGGVQDARLQDHSIVGADVLVELRGVDRLQLPVARRLFRGEQLLAQADEAVHRQHARHHRKAREVVVEQRVRHADELGGAGSLPDYHLLDRIVGGPVEVKDGIERPLVALRGAAQPVIPRPGYRRVLKGGTVEKRSQDPVGGGHLVAFTGRPQPE
jgi:enoyl-[acyl-carrier protein] reductase I